MLNADVFINEDPIVKMSCHRPPPSPAPTYHHSHYHLTGPSANHVKSNFVNQQQASSDSELHRGRQPRHLNDSLTNLGDGTGRRPQDGGVTARGIILPNVANMKQNVSEKVAQVGKLDSVDVLDAWLHEMEWFGVHGRGWLRTGRSGEDFVVALDTTVCNDS